MCKVLHLSQSAYYAWGNRKVSPRQEENDILSDQIKQIHRESRQTYDSPRIHATWIAKDFRVGCQRVRR